MLVVWDKIGAKRRVQLKEDLGAKKKTLIQYETVQKKIAALFEEEHKLERQYEVHRSTVDSDVAGNRFANSKVRGLRQELKEKSQLRARKQQSLSKQQLDEAREKEHVHDAYNR